jgi:NADH:ubiquinone oxidoreductase subunit D
LDLNTQLLTGVLRLILELDGEVVEKADPHIGFAS